MPKSGILSAGTRALGYDIVTLLGSGQFGEVYEVIDATIGRRSALKIIKVGNPSIHKAAIEAQMQHLCSHDNVVTIRTADELSAGAISYVVIEMEFIPEGSLEDRIRSGFIGCRESISHIKQILFALEHAHARGIVHRDVKPGNILLARPRTKLSDFGTVIHPASGTQVINQFYRPHAPPEAINNNEFSELCDVYAAGLTLLRAVNNISDWSAVLASCDWQQLVLDGRLPEKIGFHETIPRALRTIINRACNREPSKRYQSAAAFRGALEGLRVANDWLRVSEHEWTAELGQRKQILRLVPSTQYEVVFTVNGRRKKEFCKPFFSEKQARSYMHRLISSTILE